MSENRRSETAWPQGELEHIGRCPVCGSTSRKLLHEGLIDNVSFCASGTWNMQQCLRCEAGYLDPRPSTASLHLAYQNYHTHSQTTRTRQTQMSRLRRIRHAWANGYRNWRYGTQCLPSSRFGIVAAFLLPAMKRALDLPFRHLPQAWPGARVLDVGFGNGEFLDDALAIGWDVAGVDVDPVVVNNAKERGLDVRLGSLSIFSDQPESFDVITISHVIEHVYDPVETLRMAFKLLKPGGLLWLDTPSMDSFGCAHFGEDWRGFEAPRHLVLLGYQSMNYALKNAGFKAWKYINRSDCTKGMFMASERISLKMEPEDETYTKITLSSRIFASAVKLFKKRAEFITVIAKKDA